MIKYCRSRVDWDKRWRSIGLDNCVMPLPSQAIVAITDDLEANLKIMIDGLLGQSS
jgi:hypothetical protein